MTGKPGATGATVLVATLLTACGTLPPLFSQRTVEAQEDAATSFVTAYPAIAWQEVKERFEPNFTLTADAALALVGLPTQAITTQALSTTSVGLAVNFATPAAPPTGDAATSASAATRVPGTVPTGAAATPALGADLAPALTETTLGRLAVVDSALRTDAAMALHQKVQRINATIGKGYVPKGFRAHIVTLQVGIQPLARDLPYDAYLNVSLLPGNWQKTVLETASLSEDATALPPVVILPVLLIDNLETAIIGTAIEQIRGAGLQLGGGVKTAGARIDAKGGTDIGGAVQGYDKNSLMTVGRVNDSTVVVRLGAAQQGSSRYSMIPRTHDVAMLVLVRNDVEILSATTRTVLRNAVTGAELPSRRLREELRRDVLTKVSIYGYQIDKDCPAFKGIRSLASTSEQRAVVDNDVPLDLLRVLDTGNFAEVGRCLGINRMVKPYEEPRLRRLISELNGLLAGGRHAKMLIPLKPPAKPTLPNKEELALLYDNGETATIQLPGGADLSGDFLLASLLASAGPNELRLSAPAVAVGAKGRDVAATFSSLTKLTVSLRSGGVGALQLACSACEESVRAFNVVTVKAEKEAEQSPVSLSTSIVVADTVGKASVSVLVKKVGAKQNALLVIDGADVRSVVTGTSIVATDKGLKLAKAGTSVLELANATSSREILISVFDVDEKRNLGSPVRVRVERMTGAPR